MFKYAYVCKYTNGNSIEMWTGCNESELGIISPWTESLRLNKQSAFRNKIEVIFALVFTISGKLKIYEFVLILNYSEISIKRNIKRR